MGFVQMLLFVHLFQHSVIAALPPPENYYDLYILLLISPLYNITTKTPEG